MKYTYLIVLLVSVSIPFIYSFHPKMRLIKWWKPVLYGISITAIYFLIWDVIFTKNGIWGFNDNFISGVKIWHLPIEEWLFFWLVPFASLFIHFSLQYFKPKWLIPLKLTKIISVMLIIVALTLILLHFDKSYTLVNFSTFLGILLLSLLFKPHILQRFYLSFLVILIPFTLTNGLLTGMFTTEPVVWYNNLENLSIRFISIPVEDFGYAFSMLLMSLLLINRFTHIHWKNI